MDKLVVRPVGSKPMGEHISQFDNQVMQRTFTNSPSCERDIQLHRGLRKIRQQGIGNECHTHTNLALSGDSSISLFYDIRL